MLDKVVVPSQMYTLEYAYMLYDKFNIKSEHVYGKDDIMNYDLMVCSVDEGD